MLSVHRSVCASSQLYIYIYKDPPPGFESLPVPGGSVCAWISVRFASVMDTLKRVQRDIRTPVSSPSGTGGGAGVSSAKKFTRVRVFTKARAPTCAPPTTPPFLRGDNINNIFKILFILIKFIKIPLSFLLLTLHSTTTSFA